MISVENLQKWLIENHDVEMELTARRLQDLIRKERSDAKVYQLTGRFFMVLAAIALGPVLFLGASHLLDIKGVQNEAEDQVAAAKAEADAAIASALKRVEEVEKTTAEKVAALEADLEKAKDSKHILDEHVEQIITACQIRGH